MISIAFVGLCLLTIYRIIKNKPSFPTTSISLIPVGIFVAAAISLIYSTDISQGLKILGSQLKFLAIPFIFLIHRQGIKGRIYQYIKTFLLATSIASFITLLFFFIPIEWAQRITEMIPLLKDYIVHEKNLAFGVYCPFTERLQFSYMIGVAIFFQLWLSFKKSQNSSLFKPLVQLGILLTTLLILGARGAQISFLMASIVWIMGSYFHFIHPQISQKFNPILSYSILYLSLVSFLLIMPLIIYKKVPAVKTRYDQMQWEIGTFQDGTYSHYDYTHFTSIRRLISWKNSWSIIQKNPILGVGIGDYKVEMEKEYAKSNLGFPVNTQSQFLYYWTASGLFGLLSLLFLLGYAAYYAITQSTFLLKLLGCSFLIFYALLFLFDAPLNFQVGSITFLTFYSFIAILTIENKSMSKVV